MYQISRGSFVQSQPQFPKPSFGSILSPFWSIFFPRIPTFFVSQLFCYYIQEAHIHFSTLFQPSFTSFKKKLCTLISRKFSSSYPPPIFRNQKCSSKFSLSLRFSPLLLPSKVAVITHSRSPQEGFPSLPGSRPLFRGLPVPEGQ